MQQKQASSQIGLVDLINNFSANYNENINISKMITDIIEKKVDFSLKYDGSSFCQLTGKIIGNEKKIELKVENNLVVNVLVKSLRDLIENYCFVNGRFEKYFSILHGVQFLLPCGQQDKFTKGIDLEITDDILIQVYGNQHFEEMMKKIKKFYEENEKNQASFQKSLPIKCFKTQKELQIWKDGFKIQSLIFSLDEAVKILEEDENTLFKHQQAFLSKYKQFLST